MVANAVAHYAPDHHIVPFPDMTWRVVTALGLEHHHAVTAMKALAHRLAVPGGNDDIAVLRRTPTVHDNDLARIDTRPLHAVPFHPHQIHMRGADIEQLIEGNVPLHMICRRGWKTGGNME